MSAGTWLKTPWVLRGLVSLAFLGAVAFWVDPGDILREIQRLSPGWMALALFVSVLQVMLSAWRWQFTAGLVGVPLRYRYALREYYLALLVNQLLPGGVLGDAGRAHRHASQSASRGSAWRAVLLERASGQAAVALLVILALGVSPLWHQALGVTGFLIMAAVIMAVGSAMVALTLWLRHGRALSLPQWCATLGRDIRRSLLKRHVWYWQLSSSLAIVISYGVVMICATRAIGIEQSVWDILALTPPLLLAMLVPLSIAGWGLREGTAAGIWLFVGLPSAQGVAISLAYGVLVMLSSLPGIWVAFSRRTQATPSDGSVGVQTDVKERVVPTPEGAHTRAQGSLERVDRRHLKTRPTGADEQGRHQKMQVIDSARFDELGNRDAAAFDQNALIAPCLEQFNDIHGIELPRLVQRQYALGSVTSRKVEPGAGDMQGRGAIALEKGQIAGNASARVEYHAYGVVAADVTNGELGVVGAGGAGPDYHRIGQRSEPMQVNQAFEPVDIVGVAAFGGDSPIQALTQLGQVPVLAQHQWQQTRQECLGLGRCLRAALPVALAIHRNGHFADGALAGGQQPVPGGLRIDYFALGRRTNNTIGVGHDASLKKATLHHARARRPRQAYIARQTRQPGGLHVSH